MLAEDQSVISRSFCVEDCVPVVSVTEATCEVKLALYLTEVAVVIRVFISPISSTEKVRTDVLYSVESEAIRLSMMNEPTSGSIEIIFNPFFVDARVILQVLLGALFDL